MPWPQHKFGRAALHTAPVGPRLNPESVVITTPVTDIGTIIAILHKIH